MTFGEKLKFYRKKAGYTQEQFAAAVKLGTNTIINYENGRTYPRSQGVYSKLALALNITPEALKDDSTTIHVSYSSGKPLSPAARAIVEKWQKPLEAVADVKKAEPFTVVRASEPKELATQMAALFAGGRIPEEDKDEIMRILNEAYWKSKI